MAKAVQTSRADQDLTEIWSYVADDNPAAADRLLRDLAGACQRLADNPGTGRLRDELAPGLRSLPVGNYLVFYRPTEEGILVMRFLHGARDLPSLF